jgi:hypothetical protein
MRAYIYLITALLFYFNPQAAIPVTEFPILPDTSLLNEYKHPNQEKRRIAEMKLFVALTIPQYEKLKGKKMNRLEKFSFKLSQKRMRNMLKRYDYGEVTTLEKISWLVRGIVLGPIAVLLAYIFTTENNRELITWVWFGFAGWAIIIAILLLL